ncbi:MAG: phenylalanine--tRNA ligase subunit beta [Defluviitaleaceae bacterium]|nr:phenylalanine--tRNA ligase subunit beta [Defluviitaleaceae bacterium]
MNIPLSWLKEAANITAATDELIEKLTNTGNAVEGVEKLGEEITNVIVGKIASLERHPDADKLWVTQTDIGSETLQIVTGADNLKVGDYIPVAINGATLVGGLKIKPSKMRGLDSNGMLCSVEELGYTKADYPEAPENGIYVFPTAQPLGADARPIMQLLEEVADFDILANRPDTNSVMGMAREAAAAYGNRFTSPAISLKETGRGQASDHVTVEIQDTARCPRYIARVVENVKIAPSPQWLRRRLSTAGVRPINNIVDITNYVMLEYGQPLHAFDISTVAKKDGKHGIVVRTAAEGETFTTLDGNQRKLTTSTLLIADHEKPVGIAGVMGGENSMIRDNTAMILFESANFDSSNIRQTSRALGLRTDASARYEKGQDPQQALASVNRAMELVELLACGDVIPGMVDVYPAPRKTREITFNPQEITAYLGAPDITPQMMQQFLTALDIETTIDNPTTGRATIPTYRADMAGAADLAEEIGRMYGLNNIPTNYSHTLNTATPLIHIDGRPSDAGKSPCRRREDGFKRKLTAMGYNEALTYPFESPKVADKLLIPQDSCLRSKTIILKNPLGEDFSTMRTTPLGGLMESISRNQSKNNANVQLFELANIYMKGDETVAQELPRLTMVTYGKETDFFTVKGSVESLVATITNKQPTLTQAGAPPYLHPGRSAKIAMKTSPNPRDPAETILGYMGEIHPQVAKNYGLSTRTYVAILDVAALHEIADAYSFKFTLPPIYPALERDLALKVKAEVTAAQLEAAIREKGGQILSEVKLFDVYQGEQVGAGFKSMAYSLSFRTPERTLTVEDVEKPMAAILQNLKTKHDAEVRS